MRLAVALLCAGRGVYQAFVGAGNRQPTTLGYHPEGPLCSMTPYYNRRKKGLKALVRTFYPAHHRYAGMPIGVGADYGTVGSLLAQDSESVTPI
jgi:hypothetical protein